MYHSIRRHLWTALLALIMAGCSGGSGGSASNTPAGPPPDATAPYVTNANPAQNSTSSALSSVVLTFSEEVKGADVLANYALSGAGSGTLALASVNYLNQVATLTLTGLVNNGVIQISLSNVADLAGNALPNYTLALYGTTSSPTQTSRKRSRHRFRFFVDDNAKNFVEITLVFLMPEISVRYMCCKVPRVPAKWHSHESILQSFSRFLV